MPVDTAISGLGIPGDLAELEARLSTLSHDDQALKIIQIFATNLGKTKQRQRVFNARGALVREPIIYQDVLARGLIEAHEDPFTLLQGDIVATDAAYFMGERIAGTKFAVATSTCDLVPNRRQFAALLRVQPIKNNNPSTPQLLGELLKFSSSQRMYLPPLPDDPSDVIGNAVMFDGSFASAALRLTIGHAAREPELSRMAHFWFAGSHDHGSRWGK